MRVRRLVRRRPDSREAHYSIVKQRDVHQTQRHRRVRWSGSRARRSSWVLPRPKGRAERQGVSPRLRRACAREYGRWHAALALSTRQWPSRTPKIVQRNCLEQIYACVPHANGLWRLLHHATRSCYWRPTAAGSCELSAPDTHLDRPPVVRRRQSPKVARGSATTAPEPQHSRSRHRRGHRIAAPRTEERSRRAPYRDGTARTMSPARVRKANIGQRILKPINAEVRRPE